MRVRIVLATPTVLYAPVYLAKQLTLSREFAHVDFEYVNPARLGFGNRKDPLIDLLFNDLSVNENESIVMAVVDPIRISLEKYEKYYCEPRIIHTLIDKMCYWGISWYPQSKEDLFKRNYRIIAHPKGMTGHTLVVYDLSKKFGNSANDDWTRIKGSIFAGIQPGEEREYYKKSFFARMNNSVGYVTTDPLDYISEANKTVRFNGISFMNDKDNSIYRNSIMTSIVTSDKCLADSQKKAILEDIISGINEGIKLIYNAPHIAAQNLLKYSDRSFKPSKWNSRKMRILMDRILKGEQIYPVDLPLDEDKIENTKVLWKERFNIERTFDNSNFHPTDADIDANVSKFLSKSWRSL